MPFRTKYAKWALLVWSFAVCAGCLGIAGPKDPKMESGGAATVITDKSLIDTWEVVYRVDDKGEKKSLDPGTRTLAEFSDNGRLIMNSVYDEKSGKIKSRTGRYSVDGQTINIADNEGNTAKWPYEITGDTLVITMPDEKGKFHKVYWRRYR
jgi:hypothetical protein